jgi:hypothetical protein
VTRLFGVLAGVWMLGLAVIPDSNPSTLLTTRLLLLGVLLILPWHAVRNGPAWAVLFGLLAIAVAWYTVPQCVTSLALVRRPIPSDVPQLVHTVFLMGAIHSVVFGFVAWMQLLAIGQMRRRDSNQASATPYPPPWRCRALTHGAPQSERWMHEERRWTRGRQRHTTTPEPYSECELKENKRMKRGTVVLLSMLLLASTALAGRTQKIDFQTAPGQNGKAWPITFVAGKS